MINYSVLLNQVSFYTYFVFLSLVKKVLKLGYFLEKCLVNTHRGRESHLIG